MTTNLCVTYIKQLETSEKTLNDLIASGKVPLQIKTFEPNLTFESYLARKKKELQTIKDKVESNNCKTDSSVKLYNRQRCLDLDKKIIINTLRDDFRTLLQVNSKVFKTYKRNNEVIYQTENNAYYYFDEVSRNLTKIIKTNKRKEKVVFTFDSKKTTFAENINIQHFNIKLKIDFNQISN